MTLTGQQDGADFSTGASYLQIAQVLMRHRAEPDADLRQLWLRIVFNMLVSNCDDHLRNHGFLLTAQGWRLSPPFDVNPDPQGGGLKLLVDGQDNELDLGLARSVAPLFRVSDQDAVRQIAFMAAVVSQWRDVAGALDIPRGGVRTDGRSVQIGGRGCRRGLAIAPGLITPPPAASASPGSLPPSDPSPRPWW